MKVLTIPDKEMRLIKAVRLWLAPTQRFQGQAYKIISEAVVVGGESLYPKPTFEPCAADELEWEFKLRCVEFLIANTPVDFESGGDSEETRGAVVGGGGQEKVKGSLGLLLKNIHKCLVAMMILRAWEDLYTSSNGNPAPKDIARIDKYQKQDFYPLVGYLACGFRGLLVCPNGTSKPIRDSLGMYFLINFVMCNQSNSVEI